jgi:hypothetical protein
VETARIALASPAIHVQCRFGFGRGVQALIASGYQVYAVNPLQVARYRECHAVSVRSLIRPMRMCWPT